MVIKYFKILFDNGNIGCGTWREGDSINYNSSENYKTSSIEKYEYDEILNSEIKKKVIIKIKQKASEIILTKYEYTKQLNILKRTAQLQDIVIFGGELSGEELFEYNELKNVGIWIDFIRDQSNKFEIDIDALSINELKEYVIYYKIEED